MPIAVTAWALALFFTGKRRMALPSILLLLAFVGGALTTSAFLLVQIIGADRFNGDHALLGATVGGVSAAIAAAAAWIHWRRFHVPITVAAGAAAVAGLFLAIVIGIVQPGDAKSAENLILGFVLLLGIGVFLFAMWWDASRPYSHHPQVGRRLLASSARSADDRSSDLHADGPEQRRRQHR